MGVLDVVAEAVWDAEPVPLTLLDEDGVEVSPPALMEGVKVPNNLEAEPHNDLEDSREGEDS
jgi:hypothetical protein